jgi:hypothetical protein
MFVISYLPSRYHLLSSFALSSPIFLRAIISYLPSRYHLLSSFALSSPIFLRAIISYLPSRYHLLSSFALSSPIFLRAIISYLPSCYLHHHSLSCFLSRILDSSIRQILILKISKFHILIPSQTHEIHLLEYSSI